MRTSSRGTWNRAAIRHPPRHPAIRAEEDLRGKTISVNKGTPYEQWVNNNRERLHLTLLAFDSQADAVQAVLQGRAYANLSGNTVVRYSASRTPQFIADFVLPGTRFHWGTPFRRDAISMRNQWRTSSSA